MFEKATAVHCVSQAILREAGKYGLEKDKATVITPAVDVRFFTPGDRRPPKEGLNVATVGSLVWTKGYEYALIAVRQLRSQGVAVHYNIVGEGPDKQRIEYTIHDLGLQPDVTLHGRIDSIGVRKVLRSCDVFLLPSLSEGIANVALEAMACGVPVVASDCGGMGEVLVDMLDGYLVPPRDTGAMARCLARLARDPDLRESVGCKGREKVCRDYTLEVQTRRFVQLFRAAAGVQ